jgi:hypothetical protein
LKNVCETISGKTKVASADTFTGAASILIFPHEIASSGLAPESLPSNSYEYNRNTGFSLSIERSKSNGKKRAYRRILVRQVNMEALLQFHSRIS